MEGISTVHDVLLYASRTHGDRNAYGFCYIIDTVEEQKEVMKTVGGQEVAETKTWKYFHLSEYRYITYLEFKSGVSEVPPASSSISRRMTCSISTLRRGERHLPPLYFSSPSFHPLLLPPFHSMPQRNVGCGARVAPRSFWQYDDSESGTSLP
jgi:hypothetical protein